MNKSDMILRSFMFLPAHNKKYILKAVDSNADAIILDMEDAVPKFKRAEARENIIEFEKQGLFRKKTVFIRLNQIGSLDFVNDISKLVLPDIDGFMPSKVETEDDIVFVDKLLSFFEVKNSIKIGHYMLAPLIETTKAIERLYEIGSASDRLVALCLGGEDYLNDLGCMYTYRHEALVYPRAKIVNAARANGLLPIDTPYLNISDLEDFEKCQREAFKNGFAGDLLLNPKQIEAANRAFLPDEEKIEYSKRVIEAIELSNESGNSGVAMLDGAMVGPPMGNRAKSILRLAELAEKGQV